MNTGFVVVLLVALLAGWAIAIFAVVCLWRVFTKAGRPGWAAIVPVYNAYVLLKIVGRPGWWLVWSFVPIANVVVAVIVTVELAVAFGKSGGFAVLLIFLPFIGLPILAFGDATYRGPVADPHFSRYPPAPYIPRQYPYPQQQYPYPPQQPGPPPQEQYPPR